MICNSHGGSSQSLNHAQNSNNNSHSRCEETHHDHHLTVENPLLVSLRVCKQCQLDLMKAFEHCLSRKGQVAASDSGGIAERGEDSSTIQQLQQQSEGKQIVNLESIHMIDEVADAIPLTKPPFFQIIKDPTLKANTVFDDLSQRIERDRAVFYQSLQSSGARHQKGPSFAAGISFKAGTNAGSAVGAGATSKLFSGAIYRRTIEAKDKEIKHLREQLYDRVVGEKLEHQNVEKLRHALNKSMQFYSYAEEWQIHESARLQHDVRYLKTEMSSLMAFLINSEEEKRMIMIKLEDKNKVIQEKDLVISQIESQKQELRTKLHVAYKEYLAINEKIDGLKREAEHGSDDIISRNEILQRNISKLAQDYETASRELSASQTKVKELEFELEEMITQFNITGEGKRSSEDLNIKLTVELDKLQMEHKELQTNHSIMTDKASRLDKDLAELILHSRSREYELETKLTVINQELSTCAREKKDSETALRIVRTEIEKLSSALKTLSRTKEQLEATIKSSKEKHDSDIGKLDERIAELLSLREKDDRAMKKLIEQKEQLMFQVTDLQNNLDRELSNVNVLTFEMSQLRRTSEEKTTVLEEQVEKLNSAKVNLANDKRQLTDKIRMVRQDLKKTEDDLADVNAAFDAHKEAASLTESTLRSELKHLNAAHEHLVMDHQSLEAKQAMAIDNNVDLTLKLEALLKKQVILEQQEEKSRAEIEKVNLDNKRLQQECDIAIKERNQKKIHLDSVLVKLTETNQILMQERSESATTIKDKSEQIIKYTAELYAVKEEEKRLNTLSKELQARVDVLDFDLSDTKAALETETINKQQFEANLFEVRSDLLKERRNRFDLERAHVRIDRNALARELDRLGALRKRNERLRNVVHGLSLESTRLKDVTSMLPPPSEIFNSVDSPDIPSFTQIIANTSSVGKEARPNMRIIAKRK